MWCVCSLFCRQTWLNSEWLNLGQLKSITFQGSCLLELNCRRLQCGCTLAIRIAFYKRWISVLACHGTILRQPLGWISVKFGILKMKYWSSVFNRYQFLLFLPCFCLYRLQSSNGLLKSKVNKHNKKRQIHMLKNQKSTAFQGSLEYYTMVLPRSMATMYPSSTRK